MDKENIELNIGRDTRIICRKPTEAEMYIHSMMNFLYSGPAKFERHLKSSNFIFRRRGYEHE